MMSKLIAPAEAKIYSDDEIASFNPKRVPQHIAIIPDGNRRWAKSHQTNITHGHKEGADNLMDIVKAAKELGVRYLTFYTFSTENWTRHPEEVNALMWLLKTYLMEQCDTMIENKIKLVTIGDLSKLPEDVIKTIDETKKATTHCDEIDMVLAINYGGRDEIKRAFIKMIEDFEKNHFSKENISENLITTYLDLGNRPDPELLIRTSGESRLSNFLLWQTSYTEIHLTNTLWPDFSPKHLLRAVIDFQNRDRRLGGP